jgi:hypothetical protein
MTTTTFLADSAHQLVNWNDPARWDTHVVPNSPTVDVIIPEITLIGSSTPYASFINVTAAYTVSSLSITFNDLVFNAAGALTVAHNLTVSDQAEITMNGGGSLSADSIDNNGILIQGSGSITTTGLFLNETWVAGGLNLTAGSLTNAGILQATGGSFTVTVTPGGFTNLSGSTLASGIYRAGGLWGTGNNIYFNVGSVIDTDAANILIDGGAIYSYDDVSHAYVSLTSSLHSVAGSGTLWLAHQAFAWSNLTVDGLVTLNNAALNTTQLTVDGGGKVSGIGTIGGPILNNGTVVAGPVDGWAVNASDALLINGAITGSGTIEIAEARATQYRGITTYSSVPLELGAAASSNVFFDDGRGILKLDDVAEFTGKIRPAATEDIILLRGISFDSVTSYHYSGDSHAGTLAIQTTGGEIDLQFLGNFDTASFYLRAGPQQLSSDPVSLQIANIASAPTVLSPIAENSGARLITQADLLANFVGSSPVATGLAISSGLGTLVNNNDGTWSYTPAHDDDTGVAFSYHVNYSTGSAPETATLDITPVNDGHVFGHDTIQLAAFGRGAGGWTDQHDYPRMVADVNGDGMADIVGFASGGVSVSLATGSGHFAVPTGEIGSFGATAGGWTTQDQYPRLLGDVNGDGKADIVGFAAGGVTVSLATGNGHFAAPTGETGNFGFTAGGWSSEDRYPRLLADVNGDGKADIVGFADGGVLVALATGNGHFATPTGEIGAFGFSAGGWTSEDRYPRLLADVNGDHMADIVGFGDGGVTVALAIGNGHFATPTSEIANFGFTAGGWTSEDRYPRLLADVNGDHMADIVGFGDGGVTVALATGNGHFAAPRDDIAAFGFTAGGWTSQDLYPRTLGDVNGDGAADIIGFGQAGVHEALSHGFLLI